MNHNELFPEIRLEMLKMLAHKWASKHPLIEKIELYPGLEPEIPYVLVATGPEFPDIKIPDSQKDEAYYAKIDFFNWADTACFHIRQDLDTVYRDSPPLDFIHQWMWYDIELGEEMPSGLVNDKYGYTLYESKIAKSFVPFEVIKKARYEADIIYKAVVKEVGLSDKGQENGPKLRRDAAVATYKAERRRGKFELLKAKHINEVEIYTVESHPKRKIIGEIMKRILSALGYAKGGQWLFEKSQKLMK